MLRRSVITSARCIRCIRFQSTKATIGPSFKSKEELNEFLSTPSWSVDEFLSSQSKSQRADSIDHKTVERLLELSGLEAKPESYEDLVSILKSQVVFIDHLHSIPDSEVEASSAPSLKPLSLEDIQKSIETQCPKSDKGEEPESWKPLSLTKQSLNDHYVVREGLIKNK